MSVDDPNKEEMRCPKCGYAYNPEESCPSCGHVLDGNGFTPIQAAILRVYAGGEYTGLLPTALERGVGDGLFEFLMDELGPGEDCEDLETAIGRAETIVEQAQDVLTELRKLEVEI